MKTKKILSFVMAITLLMSITIVASARTNKPYRPEEDNLLKSEPREVATLSEGPLMGGNLTWNIENIYYYVNTSANGFTSNISAAANNWVYTGWGYNKLYPNTRTYDISLSAIDFFGYSRTDGNNGMTYFLRRNSAGAVENVNPDTTNWLFCEVYLNHTYLDSRSATDKQATIGHEFGHVWGLDHNNKNPYSLMCQDSSGRKVYTVQRVDADAFNKKHP